MQKNVKRYDRGSLRPPRRMPDGRVRVDAYLTRVGTFRYRNKDGSERIELRHPDDVFDQESMESFAQVPVTNEHPPGMLTSKTAKKHAVGTSGETVERDGDFMRASLVIYDADTIAEMESGEKVEVSNGYTCDLVEGPGHDPVYGRWDFRQTNIRANHVAMVSKGRAGAECRARMDAGEQADDHERSIQLRADSRVQHSSHMAISEDALRALNAQLKELESKNEQLQADLKSATTRADTAEGKLEVANKKVGDLNAQIASNAAALESEAVKKEKDRADKAESQVRRFDERFEGAVRARAALEQRAAMVMGPKFRMDDMTDRQVRVEVVKRLDSTKDVGDSVPDGKIEGFFEALTDEHVKSARELAEVSETLAGARTDTAPDKKVEARKSRRDLWREPLPNSTRARGAQKGSL